MSEPAITPPGDGIDGADAAGARGVAGDLRGLDARGVVEAIVEQRATADRAEARLLALAVHFVDLHPVTPDRPAASWVPGEKLPVICLSKAKRDRSSNRTGETGRTRRIAGEGTPGVAEYAVEELGAALGISYRSALQLVADALELCHRLPSLWGLVQAGRLQGWKARQVAQLTMAASPAAAGFVDRHLAHDAMRNRVPRLGRLRALVHEALLRHDPDAAAAREEAALARRGVWFDHRDSTATSQLSATLDTLDALDLDTTITDLAHQLRQLGDTSPLDVRRAHALGALAHPQHLLDLTVGAGEGAGESGMTGDEPSRMEMAERPVLRPRNNTTTHLYLHVSLADLLTGPGNGPGTGTGTGTGDVGGPGDAAEPDESPTPTGWVEQLGPATLGLVRNWLTRADSIQLRPVLHAADPDTDPGTNPGDDPGRTGGTGGTGRIDPGGTGTASGGGRWPVVDQHDPPEWMRETVILRDGHCIFPGCTLDARSCDQDHTVPYVPVDEGGPPGQTSIANLACLCRRHHRLKTFTAWRYHRLPDGDYQWTSPTGHTYPASPTLGTGANAARLGR